MNSSEILKSINSIDDRVFNDQVCKIDRLMRLYKMSRANDLSLANQLRERTNNIMKQMEKIDTNKFKLVQENIKNHITYCLTENSSKKASSKPSISSSSSKQLDPVLPSHPFGSSGSSIPHKNRTSNEQSNSSSLIIKSENSKKQQELTEKQLLQKKKNNTNNFNFEFGKKQSSAQISGSISGNYKTNINLRQFCQINGSIIEQKLAINEEVISYFKTQGADKVSLLGVQKPYDKTADKLYICTYMQFAKDQVTSMKFKAKDYQNQLNEFTNVIRFPLALCIIGQTIGDMKVHYVKFLLQMTSPLPLVIIYNQVAPQKSLLIRMSDKVISLIQNKNTIEMDSLDSKDLMKDKNKYKCINLKQIPVVKQKCVTTKPLYRKLNRQIIENDQAIMVEKSNKNQITKQPNLSKHQSDKQVKKQPIKIESKQVIVQVEKQTSKQAKEQQSKVQNSSHSSIPVEFEYIMHAKFMATVTQDFFVYIINENKQLTCRKKVKNLQESVQFIRQSDRSCALGITVKGADKKIQSQLFINQLKWIDKCPMIILKFKSLTLSKVAFLTVKPGVTEEQLNKESITYKNVESNQCKLIHVFLSGQKGDIAKYQGKNPLQQI